MKIEIKIVSAPNDRGDGKTEAQKRSVSIETHARRGEVFTNQKVDTLMEGDSNVFTIATGGRLMITTPQTDEEMGYDREQSAAVRGSFQKNDDGKADSAAPPVSLRKDSVAPPVTSAPRPSSVAPAASVGTPAPKPGEAGSNKPAPMTGKMHPDDVAQQ